MVRALRRRLTAAALLLGSCGLLSCTHGGQQSTGSGRKARLAGPNQTKTSTPAGDWARRVGQPSLPRRVAGIPATRHQPSTLADPEYEGDELVTVRRLVYRMRLLMPYGLRVRMHHHRLPILVPRGELHVDVSEHRLRARFVGPGWPVDEGSEVRLRDDVPGVYLIDGDGGRPLGPGELSNWFLGEPPEVRRRSTVRVRRDNGPPNEGPGDLLCALLAEWTHNSRDEMLPRCAGTLLPAFRFGLWAAELTAIVPLHLPRAQLRADSIDLPQPLGTAGVRALLDAEDLARIAPTPVRKPDDQEQPPVPDAAVGGGKLHVENYYHSRVVVVVQGIPIGWIKPGASGSFEGLTPGYYRIAAVRSSGQLVMSPELTQLPTSLSFGRLPQPPDQLGEPLSSSPAAAR